MMKQILEYIKIYCKIKNQNELSKIFLNPSIKKKLYRIYFNMIKLYDKYINYKKAFKMFTIFSKNRIIFKFFR